MTVGLLSFLGVSPLVGFVIEATVAVTVTVVAYRAGRAAGRAVGFRQGLTRQDRLGTVLEHLERLEEAYLNGDR